MRYFMERASNGSLDRDGLLTPSIQAQVGLNHISATILAMKRTNAPNLPWTDQVTLLRITNLLLFYLVWTASVALRKERQRPGLLPETPFKALQGTCLSQTKI